MGGERYAVSGLPRRQQWAWLVLVGFALTFPFFVARSQFLTGDPTQYLGVAESLVSGHGYTFMGRPHTTYPPGLPLLLAPFVALAGRDVVLMQAVVAVFASLSLVAIRAFLQAYGARVELIIVALVALSFTFFSLATALIRSELPYLAASALALRLAWTAPTRVRPSWALGGLGVLTAATALLRTIGVALPVAFLVAWVHRRMRRCPRTWTDRALLVGGGAGLLAAACWFAWTTQGQESYLDLLRLEDPHQPDLGAATLASMLARIPASLAIQITHLAELATGLPWLLPTWVSPVTVILAALLAGGLWKELRSPNPVLGWYVAGYGVILLAWPFDEGARFVFPIFPFLILMVWRGWTWIFDRAGAEKAAAPVAVAGTHRSVWLATVAVALGFLGVILLRVVPFPLGSRQGWAIVAAWATLGIVGLYCWRTGSPLRAPAWLRRAPVLLLAAFAMLNLVRVVPRAASHLQGRDTRPVPLEAAVEWLRQHAATGDIVLAHSAPTVHFHTGLTTAFLPITRDPRRLTGALRASQASYLLINDPPKDPYYLPTEVERFAILERAAGSEAFELAHRFPGGSIYRVRSP